MIVDLFLKQILATLQSSKRQYPYSWDEVMSDGNKDMIKDREEGRCKHKDNTRCVIEEKTEALGVKPLRRSPSGKQSTRKYSWDTWTAIDPPSLIYPVHLSPPSFLL